MNQEELFGALRALLEAGSEAEARQVLQERPELLDEEVDLLLQQLASQAGQDGDTNAAKLFAQWRELLRTARSSGTTAYSSNESELSQIVQELSLPTRLGDMPRRITLCQRALELVSRKQNAALWAALQGILGNSLFQSLLGDRAENIEQAIEHYHQALKVYMPIAFPNRCRGTAYRLGNICLEVRAHSEAAEAYCKGMKAAEELYRASIFQASREAELSETRDLYRRAGYALARSGEKLKAAEALERVGHGAWEIPWPGTG